MSDAGSQPPYGAEHALRDAALARDAIVDRGATPTWYHPVAGVGLGLVLLVNGLDAPTALQVAVVVAYAALLGLVVRAYSRRSGMMFGLRGSSRRAATLFAALVLALLLCFALVVGGREGGHSWLIWAGALLVPVVYIGMGRAYDRQVFRDIRAGRVSAPQPSGLDR